MLKNKHASKFAVTACALVMTVGLVGCNQAVTPDMSKVVFEDQEFAYDGTAKTLEVKNLSDALSYTFSIENASGQAVQASEVVNVGSYKFTATFSSSVANVVVPDPMQATLKIIKGTYDMSAFAFTGLEATYDGQAHKPGVSGVPTGVTATVKVLESNDAELANGAINAGAYKVKASFAGNENYNAIADKDAIMVVKPAAYDASGIQVTGLAATYDGYAHLPTVSGLPTGVSASYVVVKDGETAPVAGAIDVGTYHITISFLGDNNHVAIPSRTVDLVIGKATYDMSKVKIENLAHVYDGSLHTATVSGLPAGVSATLKYFPGNSETGLDGATDVGSYRVVASFTGSANYNAIDNKEATLVVDKADYDMSQFAINGLEVAYDGKDHLPTVSGVPAGVTATVKLFNGETEVQSAKNAGSYKVVVSFAGAASHNAIANREATLVVSKASYDMSKFAISDLEYVYDGNDHLPTVSGVPAGVTATTKLFNGELEVAAAKNAGSYNVVTSFAGDANYEAITDRKATLTIAKADYDMSNFAISDLEFKFDGENHAPVVSGLPAGVTATVKLYAEGDTETALDNASAAGLYNVIASLEGDSINYNLLNDRLANFYIREKVTLENVKVFPRTFNVADENKAVEVSGELGGLTPSIVYVDYLGRAVEDIDHAPVGEYDAIVTLNSKSKYATNLLTTKLIITDKTVKNISTYAELVAMAAESQANFTLYEASGVNELTGEVESWEQYNGGNPADRWANKVTYQLVNDIDCGGETWKAAGWQIGDYMKTEEKQIGGEDVTVIQGTDYVVNVPRADGPLDYGFGYVSLYLDGNGHSIKDLKLNNDTFSNTNGNELGQYPNFIDGGSYRKVGMFVSTAFSTFKDIVFEDPTMTIDDTSSTVVWAGFINATESQGNTYQGLTFNNPVISVNCKKSNIGGIAGITLALARATDPAGIRGADYYLDRPEEMEINFQDVQFNDIDYTVTGINADRNSVGGLFGENQSANLTFNLNNVDINGDVNVSNGTKNLAGDLFGYIAHKYQTKGYFVKDPDSMYKFNLDGCDTGITYTMSGSNIHVGTYLSGNSYRLVNVKAEDYVANTYYKIAYQTNNFVLADGAYDASEYYFSVAAGEEFDSFYFYIDCTVDYAWLLNYTVRVSNSTCTSSVL